MATGNDSGHSHPLFARVGNTEMVIAHLKLPVKSPGGPIDGGEMINSGEAAVVDLDHAEIEHLRRRLGLSAVIPAADQGANVTRDPDPVDGYDRDKDEIPASGGRLSSDPSTRPTAEPRQDRSVRHERGNRSDGYDNEGK